MAKGKKQSKRPQAQHKPKSRSSQHDKRKRLDTPHPRRKKTVKAKVQCYRNEGYLRMTQTAVFERTRLSFASELRFTDKLSARHTFIAMNAIHPERIAEIGQWSPTGAPPVKKV